MEPETNTFFHFISGFTDECESLLKVAFVFGAARADPEEGLQGVVGCDAGVEGQ